MRDTVDYISRWLSTNIGLLLRNTGIAAFLFFITCYAVKKGVFEEFGPTKACLFALLMCSIWSGIFNSIGIFCSERDYILDDLIKFLPVYAYIAGNVIIQLFQCLLEAVVSSVIFMLFFDYESSGLVMLNRNFDYLTTFFLVLFSADMLGLFVGMTIKKIIAIMSTVPILLVTQLLFSGCLFELNERLDKLAYITSAKWGFYALGSIADLNSYLPPELQYDYFDPSAGYILYCWRYLILLSVICILLSGVALSIQINLEED